MLKDSKYKIPRWLQLQEEIDFLYFILSEYIKQFPKISIDLMIDKATGADKKRIKEIKKTINKMKKLKKEWEIETGKKVSMDTENKILEIIKQIKE